MKITLVDFVIVYLQHNIIELQVIIINNNNSNNNNTVTDNNMKLT